MKTPRGIVITAYDLKKYYFCPPDKASLEDTDKQGFYEDNSFPDADEVIIKANDGISFSLARNETLAILGQPKCGKSTTFNMLTLNQ